VTAKEKLAEYCIPAGNLGPLANDYGGLRAESRKLMAAKIKSYFTVL